MHFYLLFIVFFFFLMLRRPPRSTLFPYTRSSDLDPGDHGRVGLRQNDHRRRTFRAARLAVRGGDRKSTRLNSSHMSISYAVFCLKKKKHHNTPTSPKHKTYYRQSSPITK